MGVENFVLLTIDSLRADHLGYSGYDRPTTPFLDELATDAAVFTDAYAPSIHTREAIPAILTGRYPSAAVSRTYRIDSSTIAEQLSREGYETGAVLSAPFFTVDTGYHAGFDTFDSEYPDYTPTMLLKYAGEILANDHYREGEDVTDTLIEFLESTTGSTFAWAHYMDVHGPYNRFEDPIFGDQRGERELQTLFRKAKYFPSTVTEEEEQLLIDHYDNAVRHLDGILQALFDRLDERGLLDETLCVVTSDHGELLGENGTYARKRELDPALLRVPLLVYGGNERGEFSYPVSTVDIAPTLAARAGVEFESDGEPLFNARNGRSTIRASHQTGLRREETTLVDN